MNPVEAEAGTRQAVAAARTRAHARAYRHSGRVRTMRRLIPVAAGGSVALLLAYLFNPFAAKLPGVSVGQVTLAGSKVRMENPRLAGFRQGTRGYEVTADAALQDVRKPSLIELQQMRGHIATDDNGGIARLSATSGLFDSAREALDLKDDIRIWTDKGEEARLRSAAVTFKTGAITSQEPVTVSSPRATVNADALDVIESGKRISFVGNVHVVIVSADQADRPHDGPAETSALRIQTSDAQPADGSR